MRKYLFLIVCISFLITSCEKDDKYEDVFKNNTSYNVKVEPHPLILEYNNATFELYLAPNETKSIKSNELYGLFQVTSKEIDKAFSYKLTDNINVIYCYDYKVRYVISGTAKEADLTYSTPNGGTGQCTRTLPYSVNYKEFGSSFLYISAQNATSIGSISVEIYFEDRLVASDSASGSYVIATASKSLNY